MRVVVAVAVLLALTGALLPLRWRWPRMSRGRRRALLLLAAVAVLGSASVSMVHISTASWVIDRSILWAGLAGYILLLILFTRLRPQWLTAAIAIVLLLPVLSSTFLLPLAELFDTQPRATVPLAGGRVLVEQVRWVEEPEGSSGIDLVVLFPFRRAPFLRRRGPFLRLNDTECDTRATTVTLKSGADGLQIHCPYRPEQRLAGSYDPVLSWESTR